MKKLIILGHPAQDSFCKSIAETYLGTAKKMGQEIELLNLASLKFDPTLHEGYKKVQTFEPDLEHAKNLISWADHLIWIYPNWWGTMPALLKGFIDRVFIPGFAFKYRQNSNLWDKLLTGKSAHIYVTMDSPPWYYKWLTKMPGHNQMKRAILQFCGISPIKITNFGPIKTSSDNQRNKWLISVEVDAARN
jgi:NAD(P)H dehydrogenase (quinone)